MVFQAFSFTANHIVQSYKAIVQIITDRTNRPMMLRKVKKHTILFAKTKKTLRFSFVLSKKKLFFFVFFFIQTSLSLADVDAAASHVSCIMLRAFLGILFGFWWKRRGKRSGGSTSDRFFSRFFTVSF